MYAADRSGVRRMIARSGFDPRRRRERPITGQRRRTMYRYVHRDRARRNGFVMTIAIPLGIYEGEEGEHDLPLPAGAHLDDDGEYTLSLTAKYEICDRCRGKGTHTNPNIDGNGITESEWAEWDDEGREMYLSGGCDVRCEAGCTDGKVLVIDEDAVDKSLKVWIDAWHENEREAAREGYCDARTRWAEDGYPSD